MKKWTHKQAKNKRLKRLKKMRVKQIRVKQHWQVIEILLLMLMNVPSFLLFSNKTYIIDVNLTEYTRAFLGFHLSILSLKISKLSISLYSSDKMPRILGHKNGILKLSWFMLSGYTNCCCFL